MPYRVASAKINKDLHEKYSKHCVLKGCSIHADLKSYIEDTLKADREVSESNNVGTKLGKNENIIPGRIESNTSPTTPEPTPSSSDGWFW